MPRALPSLRYLVGLLAILLAVALVPAAGAGAALPGEAEIAAPGGDPGGDDPGCPCDGVDAPVPTGSSLDRSTAPSSADPGRPASAWREAEFAASFRARAPPSA
jgi:hypothetical protein